MGAESAQLDPGGQRRAQAWSLVGARLASMGRMPEAAAYLKPVHKDSAAALRILGLQRLEAGDVSTAYEVLAASARLVESAQIHQDLATVLSRAGDVASASKHRKRAEELAVPVDRAAS